MPDVCPVHAFARKAVADKSGRVVSLTANLTDSNWRQVALFGQVPTGSSMDAGCVKWITAHIISHYRAVNIHPVNIACSKAEWSSSKADNSDVGASCPYFIYNRKQCGRYTVPFVHQDGSEAVAELTDPVFYGVWRPYNHIPCKRLLTQACRVCADSHPKRSALLDVLVRKCSVRAQDKDFLPAYRDNFLCHCGDDNALAKADCRIHNGRLRVSADPREAITNALLLIWPELHWSYLHT